MEDYDLLLLCMAQDGSLSPDMAKCDLVWLYISENSPAWFVIECEYEKYGQEEPNMACQSGRIYPIYVIISKYGSIHGSWCTRRSISADWSQPT